MFRTTLVLMALVAVGLVPLRALCETPEPEEEPQVDVLTIELVCNGFPGTDQKKKTRQRIHVSDDRMFMEDLETANLYIMRGDLKKAWEIDSKEKLYLERDQGYFDKFRREKLTPIRKAHARTAAKLNAISDPEKRAEEAKKFGLPVRRNGKVFKRPAVRMVATGEEKEINGFKCYRVKIREGRATVLELWLTRKFKAPKILLDFYGKFGCFSYGVAAQIDKIEDFPVVVKANLYFDLTSHLVESVAAVVGKKKMPRNQFELPEGIEPALEALLVEQVCNGFPGTREKKKTKQRVYIGQNMIFMENLEMPNWCIVRSDQKKIWEIDTKEKVYVERLFSYFEKHKKDKLTTRATAVRELNAMPEEMRREYARKLGFSIGDDGKIPEKVTARTERTGEEKEINGYRCYHLQLFEDLKVAFDVWLTRNIKAPRTLMNFYKNLGCFADEVVAQMEKIRNFPILLNAHLDFGAVAFLVDCEITKIVRKKVAKDRFELPKGLKKTRTETGEGVTYEQKLLCPVCGKEVDPNATGENKPLRFTRGRQAILFCSKKCYDEFRELYIKYKGDLRKVMIELVRRHAQKRRK